MNKKDFATELAEMIKMPRTKALEITNAMLNILSRRLSEKEKIQFVGFGSFEVRLSPERMARNPRTKEPVLIPERYKAVFKPSPQLLDDLNKDNAR